MILAALGVGMMVAGTVLVVIQTGQSWSRPASGAGEQDKTGGKPGISYPAVGLIGVGALLVMLATSGWL
jgi:hypothetical protein